MYLRISINYYHIYIGLKFQLPIRIKVHITIQILNKNIYILNTFRSKQSNFVATNKYTIIITNMCHMC